tara:strand:- start:423 stop:830 length:408 start_codon:yes stop_codon:yes gene_type:complete
MKLYHGTSEANLKSIVEEGYIRFLSSAKNSNAEIAGLTGFGVGDVGQISFADNKVDALYFGALSALASKMRGEQKTLSFRVLQLDKDAVEEKGIVIYPLNTLKDKEWFAGSEWIAFRQDIPVDLIEEVHNVDRSL